MIDGRGHGTQVGGQYVSGEFCEDPVRRPAISNRGPIRGVRVFMQTATDPFEAFVHLRA